MLDFHSKFLDSQEKYLNEKILVWGEMVKRKDLTEEQQQAISEEESFCKAIKFSQMYGKLTVKDILDVK